MQQWVKNLEFVQYRIFEFTNSFQNNGTEYLLTFEDSCEEICISKAFVNIATPGQHCGMTTIYIKHNLFYQGKLRWDVALQKTTIFSSGVSVKWWKSAGLLHSWVSDHN